MCTEWFDQVKQCPKYDKRRGEATYRFLKQNKRWTKGSMTFPINLQIVFSDDMTSHDDLPEAKPRYQMNKSCSIKMETGHSKKKKKQEDWKMATEIKNAKRNRKQSKERVKCMFYSWYNSIIYIQKS